MVAPHIKIKDFFTSTVWHSWICKNMTCYIETPFFITRIKVKVFPNGTTLNWSGGQKLWSDFVAVSLHGSAYACSVYVPPPGRLTPHSIYNQVPRRFSRRMWREGECNSHCTTTYADDPGGFEQWQTVDRRGGRLLPDQGFPS